MGGWVDGRWLSASGRGWIGMGCNTLHHVVASESSLTMRGGLPPSGEPGTVPTLM